jgi:hypothetical protein
MPPPGHALRAIRCPAAAPSLAALVTVRCDFAWQLEPQCFYAVRSEEGKMYAEDLNSGVDFFRN